MKRASQSLKSSMLFSALHHPKLPKTLAFWMQILITSLMKVKGALGCSRTLFQVPSLGPAMLPEKQRSVRSSAQSGFDINGLHNQSHESPLRHAISRTGLKKRKEIMR